MTRDRHVIEEECEEIRRLKGISFWDEIVAEKVDRTAVYYHVVGKCDHPPLNGLLGDCPED